MPSCVYRGCTNYTATVKTKDISFHALPKDGLMKEKWLKIIRAQRCESDWLPSPYSTVCSEHFLDSNKYVTKKNLCRIKKTAVPVIKQEDMKIIASPTSLEQVEIVDEESIFDSPQKANLKAKIRKISEDKRKLKLKNYNLVRTNKRLQKKYNNLKKIVLELQKRKHFTIVQLKELNLQDERIEKNKKIP